MTNNNTIEIKPGDKMNDGTIFGGISPDTNKPMFIAPADAPLKMQWGEAMEYADGQKAHGYGDWKLPSVAELRVLYKNHNEGALRGTFNDTNGSITSLRYRTADTNGVKTPVKDFGNEEEYASFKALDASVRLIRLGDPMVLSLQANAGLPLKAPSNS